MTAPVNSPPFVGANDYYPDDNVREDEYPRIL